MSKDNAIALVSLALLAMNAGHEEQAIHSFKKALKIKPDIIEAYIGMGLSYSRIGMHVEMGKSIRKAIQINPQVVRNWAAISITGQPKWLSFSREYEHLTGRMAEFLHNLDEADALTRLASAHISNGLDELAVTALEYCLTLVHDYESAIVLLSTAYLLLKARDEEKVLQLGTASILNRITPDLGKLLFSR